MIDLWPVGIEDSRVRAPVVILREQATLLGNKTKNLVQGEVVDDNQQDLFVYRFYVVAPALGGYRYRLLTVRHDVGLYPVHTHVEDTILDEIRETVSLVPDDEVPDYEHIVADNEDEFLSNLRAIFGSSKSKRVVAALLSQSDPDWSPLPF